MSSVFCSRTSSVEVSWVKASPLDRDMSNFSLAHIFAKYPGKTVAMGGVITTKDVPSAREMVKRLPYFTQILPSFCETASPGYYYMFYVGFSFNDNILSTRSGREVFRKYFNITTAYKCKGDFGVGVQFIKYHHSGKMAWAQNDALMTAYKDGMEYFYMVNDDTTMITNNWTNIYVGQLAQFYPPNVGIVAPLQYGGKTDILNIFFSHRTHIDIFHFFFPKVFDEWFANDLLTQLYEPNNVKKMPNVLLKHTHGKGSRYKISKEHRRHLDNDLAIYREKLRNYLVGRGVDWYVWNTS